VVLEGPTPAPVPAAPPEPVAVQAETPPSPVAEPPAEVAAPAIAEPPSTPEPASQKEEPATEAEIETQTSPPAPAVVEPAPVASETVASEPETPAPEKILPPIVPPMHTDDAPEDLHMITVILRPKGDKARDKLLLRRVFGIMISHPGVDRFAFHIFEHGRGHLLEFPNLTTGLSPELISEINLLVGADNVRIEPITFQ